MTPGSILNLLLAGSVLVLWTWVVGTIVFALVRRRGVHRAIRSAGGVLIVMGVVGFVSVGIAKWLPPGFEWPVGWAGEVVTTPSGMHAAAHEPSSRGQVYDPEWRFVRSWYVEAGGGAFLRVAALPDETVEIVTARLGRLYIFNLQGELLSQTPAPRVPPTGPGHVTLGTYVPTWPWLLPLSHPLLAFSLIPAGLLLVFVAGRALPRLDPRRRFGPMC